MAGEAVLGREAELDAVERFIDAMTAGPSGLVIEGEPGIGKTTLWVEAVRAAEARSYCVLQARPAESEAKLSYAALADLVGGVFDETRAVLPGVQEHALAAALLRLSDEPADPRTTAAALVGVLTTLAAERPVLVAVDDVQWLDRASERALAFAARRLSPAVGLVLTRRGEGGEEPPLGLGRALLGERLQRLVPGPLSLASLHHLIRSRLGQALPRPLLARLAGASGGNPFFALELARALMEHSDQHLLGDALPVPQSLQDLVAARVRRLSPAARDALLITASISRPTVMLVVNALAPDSDAASALVEAEEAGVVFSEHGRLRFAHPVFASVVYGSASEERRRQLHRRLANVVADPEDRAHHLAQSTLEADEAIAAEVERAAGGAAIRGAQDTAAELFEAACRLTPPHRTVDLARRSIGEANALLAIGEGAGARSCAVRAVKASGSSPLRAEALSLLGSIDWAEGEMKTGTTRLEQALVAAADDRELRGRLYAQLARVSVLVDPKWAMERAAAAARLLREERAPELLAGALIDRFFAEAMLGRGARHELFERGLELEARAGPAVERHPIPMLWFHFTDDFDAARARYAEEERLARERGWEVRRADMLGHLGMAELRAGRWELAEQYIEESCSGLVQGRRTARPR
jgi:hypothetical protein